MNPLTRSRLVGVLQETLLQIDAVDAAWEGGSAAFGSEDALSDIDAVAVVVDDAIDTTIRSCRIRARCVVARHAAL